MNSIESINSFLAAQPAALIGVSRNKKKFGYIVYKDLLKKGFKVVPVNPGIEMIDDKKCYKDIAALPSEINSIIVMTPKDKTDAIVSAAISKGIKNIWIQQKAETAEAIENAKKNGINLVYDECILMFVNPNGPHTFHRFLKRLFGRYPK